MTATLAGGCFWCLEAVFLQMKGIQKAASGYMGGATANPTYEAICSGTTGHAEVVQLEYDPGEITFRDILEVFFSIHDPTTLNRQGNDSGTQYRSAIYYHDESQHAEARAYISEIAKDWRDPIVTEVAPASTFYPAETYHQDYYARNAYQPYCMFVVSPKVKKFQTKFASKARPAS